MDQTSRDVIVGKLRTAGCVFAEDEAGVLISAAANSDELSEMLDRRTTGLPLEHVVGWAEFCGLRVSLDPGVFVPRRRTQFLVETAAGLAGEGAVALDLCCGSGAVGVALAGALGRAELHAVDIDPVAVRCARRNVEPVGGRAYEGDLYEPLPRDLHGRVDLIVACTPYVPSDEIRLLPPEARLHEPRAALDGGRDGLDIVRRIGEEATHWLTPGGHLLVEIGEQQAPVALESFAAHGLQPHLAASGELDAAIVIGAAPSIRREPAP